ncbi:HIT family protein [Streptococcus merionis]|uniref:HIT family protein n=1 Tax=Streptococcus merionis TaxID=400065 RepID=UPI0026ECFB18|nr:HIT family protein [Streptococcus merionis]
MCLICNRIDLIKNHQNPYFVKELETGYVVIGDNQHFHGYTLFLSKTHVREPYDLEPTIMTKHLQEMAMVSRAVSLAFNAEKMNIESLGNGDAHLHWHLFPRKSGDLNHHGIAGKGPVWWLPAEEMYAEKTKPNIQELEQLKCSLKNALESLKRP